MRTFHTLVDPDRQLKEQKGEANRIKQTCQIDFIKRNSAIIAKQK